MQNGRITNATRVLGKHQGYLGLVVRDEVHPCSVQGVMVPTMVTSWLPTPKEIEAIVAGAPVHVRLYGREHPPIMVEVGETPDPESWGIAE